MVPTSGEGVEAAGASGGRPPCAPPAHVVGTGRRLLAAGRKTELRVEYTLAFIAPVNRFIRSFIERGAEQGLSKNFAQLLEVPPPHLGVPEAASPPLCARGVPTLPVCC